MTRTASFYNATALQTWEGGARSWQLIQIAEDGKVYRANGHWSHDNGTPNFDASWRRTVTGILEIRRDGGRAYYEALSLPEKTVKKYLNFTTIPV